MSIWWEPQVIDLPDLSMSRSNQGGYQKPSWGSISYAPNTFDGRPPRKAKVDLEWGLTYSSAIKLFKGTIFLRKYTNEEIVYDIFEPEYDKLLLEEGEDENGDDVTIPLVIGKVEHMEPQRTGDDVEYKYYRPDFAGSIGSGIDAYDGGVKINDSWTDHEDGTISRSVSLVGTLTMSGTGNMETLVDVFSWVCSELELTLNSDLANDVRIDTVVTTQIKMIDFLDQLAWYCDHGFYIDRDTLYLVDNSENNGSQEIELGEGLYDIVSITYKWPQPVKKYTANWQTKKVVEDNSGISVETDDHSIARMSEFEKIGIEKDMPHIFNYDSSTIKKRIDNILNRDNLPRIEIELPLYRLPKYGEQISFVDEVSHKPVQGYMRAREFSLNYVEKTIVVEGDGEITFI